eukprot:TRINITY_DN5637_c0_g1_i1.p1 TRINITY_DN5637_c0_g1~~TRINITY_DN5637_c0_g1_i1.p1  ORF type:complete len:509 (+),score=53.71 TRINITY_DN5637_c0_g1_i1:39-1565(+)
MLLLTVMGILSNKFKPVFNFLRSAFRFLQFTSPFSTSVSYLEVDRICKTIIDHPFPHPPIEETLNRVQTSPLCSSFVEKVLERLLIGHANGFKALAFFRWASQVHSSDRNLPFQYKHSTSSYELILEILTRMRAFDKAWIILDEMHHQNEVTVKAISLILFKYCKDKSFDEALDAFKRIGNYTGKLKTDEFNVLLKGFCTRRHMKEARGLMNKMHTRFSLNPETVDVLMLGFKESGRSVAAEIFFRDIQRRGFKPSVVTYNTLVDALCKDKRVKDAMEVVKSMKQNQCDPDIKTYTTLIHGWGLLRNSVEAKKVFDEMKSFGLQPDIAAFNAIINSFCNEGLVDSALQVMEGMEERGVPFDNRTFHFLYSALIRTKNSRSLRKLFEKMIGVGHLPKAVTVILLLKYFFESGQDDMAMSFWNYVREKGCSPHGHAINVFVAGLCYSGKLQEAYDCCSELVEKGIRPHKRTFDILKRFFKEPGREQQLLELTEKAQHLGRSLSRMYFQEC